MISELTTSNIKFIQGLRLIRLTGTFAERATQHGRILAALNASEKKSLALHALAAKNQMLIKKAVSRIKGMSPLFAKVYEAMVYRQYSKLPSECRQKVSPLIKAASLPPQELWLSLFQPDLLMVLAAVANEKIRNQFIAGLPGCTTGIMKTQKGMSFLRNLDYPVAGHWEKWPTVFYHEPSELRGQKYVSVSSLGIHFPITGWNESGISLSLHAYFSKKFSLKGLPIFFLLQDLLENARSLEEAILICRRFRTIGSWAINIASFKEGKAATIELSNGKISIIPMTESGILAQANDFEDREFRQDEIYFSGSSYRDSKSRRLGVSSALEKIPNQEHQPSLQELIDILASHQDFETQEQRVFGNTPSVVTTIQSLIFDSGSDSIYLSNRNETPTAMGPYVKIPFRWEEISDATQNTEIIYPTHSYSADFLTAMHAYHEAYVHWQVFNQPQKKAAEIAHSFLIQATEACPTDPHLWMQRGYFELIHLQIKGGLECFELALQFKMSIHHQHVAQYFKAACFDAFGERSQALALYQNLVDRPMVEKKLNKKAEKRLKKPFLRVYCQRIVPDLQFVEPIEYA